ncbi:ATP-binding protein [Terasakiella sp.]|uniref:hybrid sensor histidine kinase/response regulator n=1 Tax=Terasakiella sp. TaxID=2034861 RepID=UPI003AA9AB2F
MTSVQTEQIRLFAKAPKTIVIGHISSFAVLLYLATKSSALPSGLLIAWAILELVLTPGLLLYMKIWAKDLPEEIPQQARWIGFLNALVCLVGSSWGMMLYLSLATDDPASFAMQMAIAAGSTAASVKSLGLFRWTFMCYGIPYLGLLSLKLILLGGDFVALAVLVLIFLLMMLLLAKDVLASFMDYVAIKNENLDLIAQLQNANAQARLANREKTRLLASASHDLRQPVHAMGLHLETLSDSTLPEAAQKTVAHLRQSIRNLSNMFTSLLDVSLLETGNFTVQTQVIDLAAFLKNIAEEFKPLADICEASIHIKCAPYWIESDPVLLRRIVQNLLSNALKYGGKGTVTLEITHTSNTLNLHVKDQGRGIAQKERTQIFEEFKRAATTPDHVQTQDSIGLGLAIVKKLCIPLHLDLDLHSSIKGSIFTVSGLKLGHAQAATPPETTLNNSLNGLHILIVDDDPDSLRASETLLAHWGARVSYAQSLYEIKPSDAPDLVLSDFSLGNGVTAFDVQEQINQQSPHSIPFIVLSGETDPKIMDEIRTRGLLLIPKPVQPARLRAAIESQLARIRR